MPLHPFASTLLTVWLMATPNDDVAAIRAVVADYTEGVKSGDEARLHRAFHPEAKLLSVGPNDALATWPGADYIQTAVKRPFIGREDAVLQVDVFGSAAVAKVSVRTSKWDFIDYISLLKLEGRWSIVSKVYHRAPREAGTVRAETPEGQVSEFQVDRALSEARPGAYHALYLPGGTHSADSLRIASGATDFVQGFLRAKKPVAAICHGLWLLADAGGVKGRRVTSFPSLRRDLQNAGATWVDEVVVVDGLLVTSRRPADLPAFNRQVVARFARTASP
ncbi:DJ-1/PfpI family protein [Corallococcus sp. AS-1-12]|uniref:DJ-1/PfpI family protein n=1 Tax=Corallococcus sp. AS-1-12 TaxID=2874598 RepID=UPI001CBBA064|nr:DJ-1/PfpI family protein [Corallococcus sp. AS-1-12]MBZ4336088.1 DJ-1/PfpI family protein [Corallococcus sp. AS-1-12]